LVKKIKAPSPANTLYENLFKNKDEKSIFRIISNGLNILPEHPKFLLEEATILLEKKRYTRADFIIATAEEEIAKSYILIDMCRLNFKKEEGPLRNLCKAFYSHITKYAYYKLIHKFREARLSDMSQVEGIFQNALIEWFPGGDIESGVPDLPGDVFFKRDINLYSDFDNYSQNWYIPEPEIQGIKFIKDVFNNNPIEECTKALHELMDTRDAGLFEMDALIILNDEFKKEYITGVTPVDNILSRYNRVGKNLKKQLDINEDVFEKSALREWPLYHFLRTR
jgi:AbiV family abortive infection protein